MEACFEIHENHLIPNRVLSKALEIDWLYVAYLDIKLEYFLMADDSPSILLIFILFIRAVLWNIHFDSINLTAINTQVTIQSGVNR